ncbi:MAG: LysR family transcriptional regulator [Siculibacillus sp.]|nr:LysR family transcriptional regulator [Siculibacillus sp.]
MGIEAIGTRHFEIFLTMVMSRSLGEAADRLGLTVAAVSKSLKVLERETGLELFRHTGGRLTATAAAESLVPYAQSAVDHLVRARRAAEALRGGETDRLAIGVSGPAITGLVPAAIARFRRERPRVRVDLSVASTIGLVGRVVAGEVDLGIGTPPVVDIDAREIELCEVRDLCVTQLCAVLPEGHRLAARSVLRPPDLAGEPLVGLPESSATTRLVAAQFHQARVSPEVVARVENAIGACALVRAGIGIALVNPLVLAPTVPSGVVARMFRPRLDLRTCLYVSRARRPTPVIADFVAALEAAAAEAVEAVAALGS